VSIHAVSDAASKGGGISNPIIYIDKSRIREGQLEKLKIAMQDLAAFVEEHMPRLISYAFFLNEKQSEMTVVAVHPDSASLAFHMDEGAVEFRKFASLIELFKIEIYGHVTAAVLERLHQKARALGSGTVIENELFAGFSR
jgi:hypothetical protein